MFPRAPTGLPRVPEHLLKAEQQQPPAGPPPDLSSVLLKLALFSLAMVLGPIGTYYATRDWYFGSQYPFPLPPLHRLDARSLTRGPRRRRQPHGRGAVGRHRRECDPRRLCLHGLQGGPRRAGAQRHAQGANGQEGVTGAVGGLGRPRVVPVVPYAVPFLSQYLIGSSSPQPS
ncbi:SPOSA6832_04240, partial [Sporobolomyces salmonicolor]